MNRENRDNNNSNNDNNENNKVLAVIIIEGPKKIRAVSIGLCQSGVLLL